MSPELPQTGADSQMGCNAWNHPPSCNCGWGGDTGGGGKPPSRPASLSFTPSTAFGGWGGYESGRFESYAIPNARCPVCHDLVIFYQSEYGGRVFFDPPLGPPWDKHPCTDNGPTSGSRVHSPGANAPSSRGSHPSSREIQGDILLREPERALLNDGQTHEFKSKCLRTTRESGWHPLLEPKITHCAGHQAIRGYDPIDNRWCHAIAKAAESEGLTEDRPTFIRVLRPEAVECQIEQITIQDSGVLATITVEAWNGTKSRADIQVIQEAKSGRLESMRKIGLDYAFRRFRSFISIDIQQSDLAAAQHWLDKAKECGSLEAQFEAAYIRDCRDRLKQKSDGKLHIYLDIHEIIEMIAGRISHTQKIARSPSSMDTIFYQQVIRNIDRNLLKLSENGNAPQLKKEIENYIRNNNPL